MSSDDFADEQMAAQARAAQAGEAQARRQQCHRKLRKRLAWAGGLLALVAVCLGAWYWGSYLPAQERARQAEEPRARLAAQAAAEQKEREEAAAAARLAAEKKPEPVLNSASRDHPWENSLGMKFVPVAGTAVLFGVWDVRVRDYAAYAQANRGVDERWRTPGFPQEDTHPVVKVSWEDAKAFCAWLTQKEQAEGKIGPSQSYRLPTDAEWSVAVGLNESRSGTPADKHMEIADVTDVYPWGRGWPPPSGAGNYAESLKVDSYAYTSPVGSFKANQYGLYDMGGNVCQWCEDWYDTYQTHRVLRGASWSYFVCPELLLSAYRSNGMPGGRGDYVGFRCVLEGGAPP